MDRVDFRDVVFPWQIGATIVCTLRRLSHRVSGAIVYHSSQSFFSVGHRVAIFPIRMDHLSVGATCLLVDCPNRSEHNSGQVLGLVVRFLRLMDHLNIRTIVPTE